MLKTTFTFLLLVASLAIPAMADASGSTSSGQRQSGPRLETVARPVDQFYEFGKAVYRGKVGNLGKIKYCVAQPDSDVGGKLRGKTVKPYKSGDANDFANRLYDCDNPDSRIVDLLPKQEMVAVLYYLNKRYKMNMVVNPV